MLRVGAMLVTPLSINLHVIVNVSPIGYWLYVSLATDLKEIYSTLLYTLKLCPQY